MLFRDQSFERLGELLILISIASPWWQSESDPPAS